MSDLAVLEILSTLKDGLRLLLLDLLKKKNDDRHCRRMVADDLDFSTSEISDYLGLKRVPSLQKLIKIAAFREQTLEALLAELLNRPIETSTSKPIEEQIRSLDTTAKFNLMKLLVMQISGGTAEQLDAGRKITPQMIDQLDLEETIEILTLLIERQRTLLKSFSARKVSR